MSAYDAAVASVLVAVDPAAAFELFTRDIDAWWKRGPAYRCGGERSELRFEPGPAGRLVEVLDTATGEEWELGRVRVWEPGERLVLSWRIPNFTPDQSTEVEVRFEPRSGGTYVTVEHRGWDGIPPGHPAYHGRAAAEACRERGDLWLKQLRALRAAVA